MVMAMRDWFIKDLGWKFFSLVLAVAIWLTVNYKNQDVSAAAPRREIVYGDLPVMTVKLLPGRDTQFSPAVVTVTVSGPNERMATLQANEILAFVNLSGVESGNDLRRSVTVAVPPGLTYSVDPPDVSVTVSSSPSENKEKQP
jgi:YbbR domain-containing protein